MSHMYWMFLMFYFIMMFTLMITYIYFTIHIKPSFFAKELNVNKINWVW